MSSQELLEEIFGEDYDENEESFSSRGEGKGCEMSDSDDEDNANEDFVFKGDDKDGITTTPELNIKIKRRQTTDLTQDEATWVTRYLYRKASEARKATEKSTFKPISTKEYEKYITDFSTFAKGLDPERDLTNLFNPDAVKGNKQLQSKYVDIQKYFRNSVIPDPSVDIVGYNKAVSSWIALSKSLKDDRIKRDKVSKASDTAESSKLNLLSQEIRFDPIITAVNDKTFGFKKSEIKDAIELHRKASDISKSLNLRAFSHSDDCGAEAVLLERCIRSFEIKLQSVPYFSVEAKKVYVDNADPPTSIRFLADDNDATSFFACSLIP